jgi:hypothetical protein
MGLTELRHRVQRGEAKGHDRVWREGVADWELIRNLAELRPALEASPMVQRTSPPALAPPRETAPPAAVQGSAPESPAPTPAPARPQVQPQVQPMARWPVLTLAASGLVLLAAVVVVILGRRGPGPATPASSKTVVFMAPRQPGPEATAPARHGPMEIRAQRGRRSPRRRVEATPPVSPDAAPELPPQLQKDFTVATATQIHRSNRSVLAACDGLAERRGERLKGTRARFTVRVSAEGKVETTVTGEGLSSSLLLCYSSVAGQFQAPAVGRPYSVVFSHVH